MDEVYIDENLLSSLNKICCDLLLMLQKTETILSVEKQKYEQVLEVCRPWPAKKIKSETSTVHCTCSESYIRSDNSNVLVDDIPSIVSQAKSLRAAPYASSSNVSKYANTKKSIHNAINNSKNVDKVKVSTVWTVRSSHGPSCLLSTIDSGRSRSISNLSDAVTTYGVPERLNRVLNDYYKFVLKNKPDVVTTKVINSFLKYLKRQSDETWRLVEENVEKLPKYMLALSSIEKTSGNDDVPCVIYRNVEELGILEKHNNDLNHNEMWHDLLRYLNREFTSVLLMSDLTRNQKIYVCKMLHAVCRFSTSRVPKVPIFRNS